MAAQRRCVCPAGTLPFRSRSDRRGSRLPGKGPYRAPWSKELRLAPVVMTQIRPDHQAPITLYQRIIVAQAGSVVVHTALAEYLIAIGRKDRAKAEVSRAASLVPHDPNSLGRRPTCTPLSDNGLKRRKPYPRLLRAPGKREPSSCLYRATKPAFPNSEGFALRGCPNNGFMVSC